jgi:hypothetical protein
MDILKHRYSIKPLIFFASNSHAKMAPDSGRSQRRLTRAIGLATSEVDASPSPDVDVRANAAFAKK